MSAQIRPNRMDVTDRFPMLGFSVRTDEPNVNAEVVLATEIGLFQPQSRASRTAANFYSSREHGLLTIPRGEGVFVVPSEVLARFIGHEKLYFGLAIGHRDNGGLQVEALPRAGSPYVALRGFTGRSLRRTFGSRPDSRPVLEWAGDTARPGSERAHDVPSGNGNGTRTTTGDHGHDSSISVNGEGGTAMALSGGYDDGFGEMPALPGDQLARASRIGGAFADRIGEALDRGFPAQKVDPLLDVLEQRATAVPLGHPRSLSQSDHGARQPAPPAARARAMDGGAAAAIAIGGFVVQSIRDSRGDITWELDQFRGLKHPNDAAPANPAPFRDAPAIALNDWPVWEGLVDDISAWFRIDWQYNGLSLGNVRIQNIGTNDRVGFGLHVRAQIMDDNRVHPPGNCAALRVTLHYRFTRVIGSEGIAVREIVLYGDGTHEVSGRWLQSSALAYESSALQTRAASGNETPHPAPPPPRARALDNPRASAGIAIGGFVVQSIRDSQGDITWELDQFRGLKHPNDAAPANPAPFRDAPAIALNDWPVWEGLVDDISAWFRIDWQYNGLSLGNVRIQNIGTNDRVGFGLHVRAQIMDDNRVHPPGNCAALRVTLHYRFTRVIGSEGIAVREIVLYGDGTHEVSGRWLQSSALAYESSASRGYASV